MLPYFQVWNRKYLMIPNGSIKYLLSREKTVGSIRRIIKNILIQFKMFIRKGLMLPNRSIHPYLAEKNCWHHNKNHKKYAYTVSSVES